MVQIKLSVTRPTMIAGQRAEVGRRVEVQPSVAADLIACGKAQLVHDDDALLLREAVRASTLEAIRRAGRPWFAPEPGHGWQRVL